MNILVTGAAGFIGKNLIAELSHREEFTVFPFDIDTPEDELFRYTKECDFVVHLAGVNRPVDPKEFTEGNRDFTKRLLLALEEAGNRAPVLMTSSIQAALENDYGNSKRAAEELLFQYEKRTGVPVYVYRLPNVFGKWCRPHYNSAVATFCHNIARGLPITITDPSREMELVYIDDVLEEILCAIQGAPRRICEYCTVQPTHKILLGDLAALIQSFPKARTSLAAIDMEDPLTRKLYACYLSYLPKDAFSYPLVMHEDARGSFTEFLKSPAMGQVSVNIARPGITKGNHWHHSKNEKFLVVYGKAVIRFRHILTNETVEYPVDGSRLTVVDIPTGYTHHIENVGDTDLVTLMWASEPFDPHRPDTYYMPL